MTWRARLDDQSGMTLIELLVGMSIFLIVSSALFGTVLSASRASDNNRVSNNLNEEARVVLNRVSRELREANRVVKVVNPQGSGYDASGDRGVTFEVDFNGNGVIEPDAADPERLTYLYDVRAQQVLLQAAGMSLPVLAGNVSDFRLSFQARSTNQRLTYDGTSPAVGGVCGTAGGTKDGIISWEELDGNVGAGDCNGTLDVELSKVDSIIIDLAVLEGSKRQVYRTQVDLRNAI